jgi:hypothetical protein
VRVEPARLARALLRNDGRMPPVRSSLVRARATPKAPQAALPPPPPLARFTPPRPVPRPAPLPTPGPPRSAKSESFPACEEGRVGFPMRPTQKTDSGIGPELNAETETEAEIVESLPISETLPIPLVPRKAASSPPPPPPPRASAPPPVPAPPAALEEAMLRDSMSWEADLEMPPADARLLQKSSETARLRRAQLARYVRGVVIGCAALCVIALVRVAIGSSDDAPPPPVAAVAPPPSPSPLPPPVAAPLPPVATAAPAAPGTSRLRAQPPLKGVRRTR